MTKPQYGYAHRKARVKAIAMMVNGTPCPRCNRPMYKTQRLQLGHVVSVAMGGTNGPTRLEHGHCNESSGARLGNRLRAIRAMHAYDSDKGMGKDGNKAVRGVGTSKRLPKW